MRFDDLEVMDLNEDEIEAGETSSKDETSFEESAPNLYHRKRKLIEEDDDEAFDWKKEAKSLILTLIITLVVVFVLKNYIIINANVPTGSMENTIMPDDNILGYRLAYLKEGPERGDVIFFYFPDDETQKYVKRVVGLPGETVYINEGKIYINGSEEPLDEPYLKEEWVNGTGPYMYEVPEDSYFCLGDNRNDSADARYWKKTYVTKEKIIGKAIFTYFPFDRWGFVE